MITKTRDIHFNAVRVMHEHISKRDPNISSAAIVPAVFEFLANNENEMLRIINEKKDFELKLKNWLKTPVDSERTNSLEEHDIMI
jgi:hypothetical protein